jgi:hypothetical protein
VQISGVENHVYFNNPVLPPSVSKLWIHNLEAGSGTVDLLLVHRDEEVSVDMLRREGDVQVLVSK